MDRSLRAGSTIFAAAMAATGLLTLMAPEVAPALAPFPAFSGRTVLVSLWGGWMLLSGAAMLVPRSSRVGTLGVAWLLTLSTMLVHWPRVATHPGSGGAWAPMFEAVTLAAVAWTLALLLGPDRPVVRNVARICFGVSFLAFGAFHFIYRGYIESVIPGWIPGHTFFAVATGCAHVAAGLAILTRVKARLAATLLAVMFGSWVVIVHIPRVLAGQGSPVDEWSSLLIAVACCGGAWIMALSSPFSRETVHYGT